jgi:hypothetical protein
VGKPEISIEAPVEVHGADLALLTASLSSSELSTLLMRLGSGRRALPIDGTSPVMIHHKSYIIEVGTHGLRGRKPTLLEIKGEADE